MRARRCALDAPRTVIGNLRSRHCSGVQIASMGYTATSAAPTSTAPTAQTSRPPIARAHRCTFLLQEGQRGELYSPWSRQRECCREYKFRVHSKRQKAEVFRRRPRKALQWHGGNRVWNRVGNAVHGVALARTEQARVERRVPRYRGRISQWTYTYHDPALSLATNTFSKSN